MTPISDTFKGIKVNPIFPFAETEHWIHKSIHQRITASLLFIYLTRGQYVKPQDKVYDFCHRYVLSRQSVFF